MSEESTTPDLVALTRQLYDPANLDRRDFDAMLAFSGPDAVWDMSLWGLGTFEGPGAIRGFFEDWIGAYEEFAIELEEILDLGAGVVFVVLRQNARPVGSDSHVELRNAAVFVWCEGVILRTTIYPHIDDARAAAERLAGERSF
jgi:ketosteroid isomerase-like protein